MLTAHETIRPRNHRCRIEPMHIRPCNDRGRAFALPLVLCCSMQIPCAHSARESYLRRGCVGFGTPPTSSIATQALVARDHTSCLRLIRTASSPILPTHRWRGGKVLRRTKTCPKQIPKLQVPLIDEGTFPTHNRVPTCPKRKEREEPNQNNCAIVSCRVACPTLVS